MTIYGWDMSHFDAPDIGTALSEGISFVTHKAGGDANDSEIAAWWNGVKSKRGSVLLGAYWVLYPGDPDGRADAFLARLDSVCSGWRDGPFILQADCEPWGGNVSTAPRRADIRAFCDHLVARAPKLRPIVYAPKWHYGDSLAGLGYPLWQSTYVSGAGGFKSLYPGDGSSKWGAYSGQTPAVLQFSSSATIGGYTTCDANAYRGTLAQLSALVAPGWENEEMAIESNDVAAIAAAVWKYQLTNAYSNAPMEAGTILRYVPSRSPHETTWAKVDGLAVTLASFIATESTDDAAKQQALQLIQDVVASLRPSIVADVIAALPQGGATATQEQVTNAVEAAFHNAFGGSA